MDYKEIDASQIDLLWEFQKQYKAEIGEDIPNDISKKRLKDAISKGEILFFGAWEGDALVGCCSITVGFQLLTICQVEYLKIFSYVLTFVIKE